MRNKFKVGDIVAPIKGRVRSNGFEIKDIIKLKVARVSEVNGWTPVNYDLLQCKVLEVKENDGYRQRFINIYSNSVDFALKEDDYSVF